jgi:hypothetical protein
MAPVRACRHLWERSWGTRPTMPAMRVARLRCKCRGGLIRELDAGWQAWQGQ